MYAKAHGIDDYVLSKAMKQFPDHSISVVNKWGVAVCGTQHPDSQQLIRIVEHKEGEWAWEPAR